MRYLCSFLLLTALSVAHAADLTLAPLFTDNAVLQQGKKVPVWGWANPGDKVEVDFKGSKAEATADADGRWQADLPALAASSDPAELTIKCGSQTKTLHNVVVGEVWFCSGQSNMEFRVDQVDNADKEIADAANYPLIRQFRVPKAPSEKPLSVIKGEWVPANPKSVALYSAAAYFFARDIYQTLKVPVGLINASFGGKMIETFMSPDAINGDPAAAALKKRWDDEKGRLPAQLALWEKNNAKAAEKPAADAAPGETESPAAVKHMSPALVVEQHRPSCLFNAMLYPVIPYAIRGMLWYQGEHNIARAEEYQTLFPSFIKDMRQKFGQGDFPFYFVQLANFEAPLDKTREGFARLREAQLMTLALPNTGMAVTIDIGNPKNIHPHDKQDVGLRLARWAKNRTYNLGGLVSGPLFKSAVKDGAAIKVSFDYVGDGLVAKPEPLGSFEIAGADGKFVPATARIDGETVIVQADAVKDPVSVRYAWGNSPVASLFNKDGLPASPFRSTLH